jgi:hypothetical protein
MQRGDFASQAAGIQILRNIGYYSDNDIARELRENPIPASEGGDIRTVQGAMIPLTALLTSGDESGSTTESEAGETQPFNRIAPPFRKMFESAVEKTIGAGNDKDFMRRTFEPVVASMAQTMLAIRFGNVELTKKELALIEAQTIAIADTAPAWEKKNARPIANRITEQVYGAIAKEILE